MNYYSEDIINNIIDTSDVSDIIDKISDFRDDIHMLFVYFAFEKINLDYIEHILRDKKNKTVFR